MRFIAVLLRFEFRNHRSRVQTPHFLSFALVSLLSSSGLLWSEEFNSEHLNFWNILFWDFLIKMGLDIEAAFNKADTDHSGFIGEWIFLQFQNSFPWEKIPHDYRLDKPNCMGSILLWPIQYGAYYCDYDAWISIL